MPNISVDLIQPFIFATVETYTTMLGTTPKAGQYSLNQGRGISHDISGVIGITGDLLGSVSLSYRTDAALATLSAFIGVEIKNLDDDSMDAVGELVNIIAGYAKKFIAEYETSISLPTVYKGTDLMVKEPADVFNFTVPFSGELGDFALAVGLKHNPNNNANK